MTEPLRVLDLFSGLEGWSTPFRERGHECVTLDLEPAFGPTIAADILEVKPELIIEAFGGHRPDIVLASPPCEAFSVLTIGRNWTGPKANPPHHPKTEKAELAERIVRATFALIDALEPAAWLVENPMAKLRKLSVVSGLERRSVTYCQYGHPFRKPTDLWGGFPKPLELPTRGRAASACTSA